MSTTPSSAIGIDVGRHSMKAVRLQRRGARRLALTHFAVKEFPEESNTLDHLEENLKGLLHELGASAKACGIALSSPEALVRIIEQNTIPPELLRDALRINGPMLLSQDCREWVIDCRGIPPCDGGPSRPQGAMERYLVGGIPRKQVQKVYEAATKNKLPANVLQLPPIALLNAFEQARPDVFKSEAFALLDIGHLASTVMIAVKGELILIRSVEYGGSQFTEHLILQGAANFEEIVSYLQEEEVLTVENARLSLGEVVRAVNSSIGFFEAQREEAIPKVYVSGGLLKMSAILTLLIEELHLPCETWNPFGDCELNLPRMRSSVLGEYQPVLGAAFGVAAEILKGQ